MSRTRPTLPRLAPSAPGVDDRPFLELADGLREVYGRLQPAASGDPSPGDRLAALAGQRGPLADSVRDGVMKVEALLRWLRTALGDLEPWLIQVDVLLAFGVVLSAALDGAEEAGRGLVALGEALVKPDTSPAKAYQDLGGDSPIREQVRRLQSKAAILPPPEDLEAARAALDALLAAEAPAGGRSIPQLRAQMGAGSPP